MTRKLLLSIALLLLNGTVLLTALVALHCTSAHAQAWSNSPTLRNWPRTLTTQNLAVAVPQAGNTTILTLDTRGVERITVEIAVTVQALDAFLIQGKAHGSGSTLTLYSASGDYTSPKGVLIGVSGDLTTLAAGSSGWLVMDSKGFDSIIIQASSGNVAGSTISVFATGE